MWQVGLSENRTKSTGVWFDQTREAECRGLRPILWEPSNSRLHRAWRARRGLPDAGEMRRRQRRVLEQANEVGGDFRLFSWSAYCTSESTTFGGPGLNSHS